MYNEVCGAFSVYCFNYILLFNILHVLISLKLGIINVEIN